MLGDFVSIILCFISFYLIMWISMYFHEGGHCLFGYLFNLKVVEIGFPKKIYFAPSYVKLKGTIEGTPKSCLIKIVFLYMSGFVFGLIPCLIYQYMSGFAFGLISYPIYQLFFEDYLFFFMLLGVNIVAAGNDDFPKIIKNLDLLKIDKNIHMKITFEENKGKK